MVHSVANVCRIRCKAIIRIALGINQRQWLVGVESICVGRLVQEGQAMSDLSRLGTATVIKALGTKIEGLEALKPTIRHKYGAKRTERDGIKFDSKLEARYYSKLVDQKASGVVIQFLRQVPFHLPGGVRYVCDFLVFWADGNVEFVDTKGVETQAFKNKVKQVEELYFPIKISVVKKV